MVLKAIAGDITRLEVDAIVNAANGELRPGGGVCGAIHRAAGPELARECARLGPCPTGQAVMTRAYNLHLVKAIIHAVGPIYSGLESHAQLRATYVSVFELCERERLKSVAVPCISTGIYGFPQKPAAEIAVAAAWAVRKEGTLREIIFCCFLDEDLALYRNLL